MRENRDGVLYSLNYGKLVAANVDPIEKKPFFHFLPGTTAYSIATAGCNFRCSFCQNWEISQAAKGGKPVEGTEVAPEEVVRAAKAEKCASIAYTYVEPTIFFEYAYDVSVLAKKEGIKNVWVSNGSTAPKVLKNLMKEGLMDANNVDLKAFNPAFYQRFCGADLEAVKENLKLLAHSDTTWLEVTSLLIPNHNDSEEEIRAMATFVFRELGAGVPWHVSAFYPAYKMLDVPPTPASTLVRAREIGLEVGLHYVYTGNVPGLLGENTFCSHCGELLIERQGYCVTRHDRKGVCKKCGTSLAGVF